MPEQISQAQLDALKKYTSPEISDTIRMMGVRPATEGYLGYDIRCLFPDLGPMVGFAVTAVLDNLTPDRPVRPDVQRRYLESIDASPKPAVIVMKAGGHNRVRSLVFGGIMANTARSLGAIGLVTDGGVRDTDEVYEIGFRMFAPGTVSAHGNRRVRQHGGYRQPRHPQRPDHPPRRHSVRRQNRCNNHSARSG